MIRWFDWIARAGLAALFFYAGALKLRDPVQFAGEIENYRLLSANLSMAASYFLPWLEIVAGIALLGKPLRLAGWLLTVVLAIGFSAFVISAWARGLDISCGCFGSASGAVGWPAIMRAVGILVVACGGLCYEARELTRARQP